ncbi:MAG: hypothetical protein AAF575_15260 [Bacteroidota bacterium]
MRLDEKRKKNLFGELFLMYFWSYTWAMVGRLKGAGTLFNPDNGIFPPKLFVTALLDKDTITLFAPKQ